MPKSKVIKPDSKPGTKKPISEASVNELQHDEISAPAAQTNGGGSTVAHDLPCNEAGVVTAPSHSAGKDDAKAALAKSRTGVDLSDKIKELVRLAQEQGYLTYNDINEALPNSIISPEEIDEIYIKLR